MGVTATGDALREGTRNSTATKETEIIANVKDVPGPKDGYSTRQSNLSSTGGEDVTNNAISTDIVTANNPDAGTDVQLSGSSSSSPCFFDFVNCGPAGTDKTNGGNAGVFVVTPRNADGTDPGAGDRYLFYAFVSDSESQ